METKLGQVSTYIIMRNYGSIKNSQEDERESSVITTKTGQSRRELEPLVSSNSCQRLASGGLPPLHPGKSSAPISRDTHNNSAVFIRNLDDYRNEKYPSAEVLSSIVPEKKKIAKQLFQQILGVEELNDDDDIEALVTSHHKEVEVGGAHDNPSTVPSKGMKTLAKDSLGSTFWMKLMRVIVVQTGMIIIGALIYEKVLVKFDSDDDKDIIGGVAQGTIISGCWLIAIGLLSRQEAKEREKETSFHLDCIVLLKSVMILVIYSLFGPVVLFFCVIRLFVTPVYLKGMSMYPTLENSNIILHEGILTKILRSRPYMRNELVCLYRPKMRMGGIDIPASYVLKRIVAIEGDTVEMFFGNLYINSVKQEESFIAESAKYTLFQRIPDRHVLVLGDNRNISFDGHNYGAVPTKSIVSRAIFKLKPYGSLHS